MQSKFLEGFEGAFGPAATVILATIVVLVPIIISCIVAVRKLVKYLKDQGALEQRRLNETTEQQQMVSDVKEGLDTMSAQLAKVSEETSNLKNELNSKMDDLWSTMTEIKRESKESDNNIMKQMGHDEAAVANIASQMNLITDNITLLIESDKESIKALITNTYYDAQEKGYIPMYKLQSMETIFEKYLKENGNTFVGQLMKELREMPHEELPPKSS